MKISPEIIEDIKFRNNIETVISSYMNLKRAGSNYNGLCPFHSEKTPSFTVFPATQSFYCFGCGAGGDAITFTMRMENVDYVSAIRLLAARCGITIPENEDPHAPKEISRQRILDMNKEAARFFHNVLLDENLGKPGRDYIMGKRGFSPAIVKHFYIGYAPNSYSMLYDHLKKRGFADEEMEAGFLCKRSDKNKKMFDLYRDRVIFPIADVTGNVIAFGGRRIDGIKELKYLNTNDTPAFKKSKNLYALNYAKSFCEDHLILCEGYADVVALHAAGFENAVATLGTAITPEQARLFSRYTKKVIISYDDDEAGQRAANKAFKYLQEVGVDVRILKLDGEGVKDPDEYINKYGKEKFATLINGSKSKFEFEMERILSKHNISIMDERVKASRDLCYAISNYPSEVERELYARSVSKVLEIPADTILRDVKSILRKKKREDKNNEKNEIIRKTSGIGDRVNPEAASNVSANNKEEAILGLMMLRSELLKAGVERLCSDDFVTSLSRKIFEKISEMYKEYGKFDIGYIQADFSIDEIARITRMVTEREALSVNDLETLEQLIVDLKDEKTKKTDDDSLDSLMKAINNKKS